MPLIYAIVHTPSGFAYVGCTKANLNKRMREHRCLLNQGKHLAIKMQQDWKTDGEKAFQILELERLPQEATVVDKRVRELFWMQKHQDRLYNVHQVSFAPTPEAIQKGVASAHKIVGNRWTEETNRKRSEKQLGIPKNHGAKISATKRARALERQNSLMR